MDLRALYRKTQRTIVLKSVIRRILPVEVQEVDGLRYRLHPRDNATERYMWAEGMMPEPRSLKALCDIVTAHKCLVLDIGGNCGAFVLPLVRAAQAGSVIRVVEPNAEMVARIRENLALNDMGARVDIVEAALAEGEGEATLTLHRSNLGQSSLAAVSKAGAQVTVRTLPYAMLLDRLTEDMLILMKIDIEGYEDHALWPILGQDTARLPDAVLIETLHADQWQKDILGQFKALGYETIFSGEGNTLLAAQSKAGALRDLVDASGTKGPQAPAGQAQH